MTPAKASSMLAQAEKAEDKARAKLKAAQREHAACMELIAVLRKMAGLPEGGTADPEAPESSAPTRAPYAAELAAPAILRESKSAVHVASQEDADRLIAGGEKRMIVIDG